MGYLILKNYEIQVKMNKVYKAIFISMFILFSLFICFKNNFTPTLCIHSIMAGASFIMTK